MKNNDLGSLVAALQKAGSEHPDLAYLFRMQEELAIRQEDVLKDLGQLPAALAGRAPERWVSGQPAVFWDDLDIDWEMFAVLLRGVASIALKHLPWTEDEGLQLSRRSAEELRLLCKGWYLGDEQDTVVAGLIAAAVQPWLDRARNAVGSDEKLESWRIGFCPICGGLPDLAILEEKVGARQLCCSRCDFAWDYSRLGCAHCGNEDSATLAYYLGDDKFYRLYVCDLCRGYLKTLDLREANRIVVPQVERILALSMDLAAQEQGYKP